jgi:hypothetical protein
VKREEKVVRGIRVGVWSHPSLLSKGETKLKENPMRKTEVRKEWDGHHDYPNDCTTRTSFRVTFRPT